MQLCLILANVMPSKSCVVLAEAVRNPPTRVGVTWKYLMQDPNDVE